MITVLSPTQKTESNHDLSGMLKSLEAQCRKCSPITPLECINRCRVYKLKNELRRIRETMNNPNYMKELFNVLKNQTRLLILQAIVNGRYSVSQLQRELKQGGYSYSQSNLVKEYLRPLIGVGLAANSARDEYCATGFGGRLMELLGCFPEFAVKLPTDSECYEESLLESFLSGPKTFAEINELIPTKAVSRTLKRLRSVGLIETPKANDYIFFFRTKRDSTKETLTSAEQRIYGAIADEGISAGKLVKETGLCMRRIYIYLRCLKGKKLVFARRTPKVYGFTFKGQKLALVLQGIEQIVEDTWSSSQLVMGESAIKAEAGGFI